MSGHSHWATIKHKKGAADAKRGKAFSKMARVITVAAKEKGGDPETNPALRLAIDQAKKVNMPKDNIERAIKKGTGELVGEKLEEVIFEAYGPDGIAIIIEGITDNKNRTYGEIKNILSKHNGKIANEGAVRWMFERKGVIVLDNEQKTTNKEEVELKVIEAGAEDIDWDENTLFVYTKVEDLENIKKELEEDFGIDSSRLEWVAKDLVKSEKKDSIEKLFEALDENDDVQNIYSNLK